MHPHHPRRHGEDDVYKPAPRYRRAAPTNDVFLSYRRADSAAYAGRIYDRLDTLFPNHIFMDVEQIKPGVDFVEAIRNTLASCKALIVLIANHWLHNTESQTQLGDANDFVTLEICAALELNIPIIPILLGGASMPAHTDLPPQLHRLSQMNAVAISHERFTRDMEPLIQALYELLGFRPPTAVERFMESLSKSLPLTPEYRYNEKMRELHAMLSLFFGIFMVLTLCLQWRGSLPADLEYLFFPLAGAYVGIIGMNSARRRKLAMIGLWLSGVAFVLEFYLYEHAQLVMYPTLPHVVK